MLHSAFSSAAREAVLPMVHAFSLGHHLWCIWPGCACHTFLNLNGESGMCLQVGFGITEEQRRQTLLELMESTLAPRKAAANLDMDLIEPVRPASGQQVCSSLQRMLAGLIIHDMDCH